MSIAHKLFADTDLSETLMESDLLAGFIARITSSGSKSSSSADALAHLLVEIRQAVSGGPDQQRKAIDLMSDAIELAFLRTPTYRAALEPYTQGCLGMIEGGESAFEVIAMEINRSTDEWVEEEIADSSHNGPFGVVKSSRSEDPRIEVMR